RLPRVQLVRRVDASPVRRSVLGAALARPAGRAPVEDRAHHLVLVGALRLFRALRARLASGAARARGGGGARRGRAHGASVVIARLAAAVERSLAVANDAAARRGWLMALDPRLRAAFDAEYDAAVPAFAG